MRVLLMHCEVCGKPNRPGNNNSGNKYCSAKCKQKAYRRRKKQSEIANANTLQIEDWLIQKWMIENGRDGTDVLLGSFFQRNGKECYVDMMRTLLACGLVKMGVA